MVVIYPIFKLCNCYLTFLILKNNFHTQFEGYVDVYMDAYVHADARGIQRTTLDVPPQGLFTFVLVGGRMEDTISYLSL